MKLLVLSRSATMALSFDDEGDDVDVLLLLLLLLLPPIIPTSAPPVPGLVLNIPLLRKGIAGGIRLREDRIAFPEKNLDALDVLGEAGEEGAL